MKEIGQVRSIGCNHSVCAILLSPTWDPFGLAYRYSSNLAAARLGGYGLVYSEDLRSEQAYDGLRRSAPFTN